MELRELMVPAAETAIAVVEGVGPGMLSAPTPCTEFDVRALLDHLAGWTGEVALAAARKEQPPESPDTDPATYGRHARAAAVAWSQPAAWEGEAGLSAAGTMPAGFIGGIVFGEFMLHGWDLAVATGQKFAPDEETVAALHAHLTRMADMARQQGGVFGPEVPVPADAPLFDRALGLAGRDPGWTP